MSSTILYNITSIAFDHHTDIYPLLKTNIHIYLPAVHNNKKLESAITALDRNHYGKLLISGDTSGLFQICDETFREIHSVSEAHNGAIQVSLTLISLYCSYLK